MTTLFEEARKLHLPGIVVRAHIDPSRISPRIKSMAQKMLRAGVLTGGWQSQAKRLAVAVIEATDPTVPHIRTPGTHGSTVYNSRPLTDYSRMDELIEANHMLKVLHGGDAEYSRQHAEKYKRNIRVASIEGEYIGVGCGVYRTGGSYNTLCAEFVAAFTDTYTPSVKARHAALAALLVGSKVIPISI
jgi:hypothetical protein